MIRAIHHVGMHAKNFDAMRRFYHDAFGFEEVDEVRSWTPSAFGDKLMGVTGGAGRLVTMKAANCFIELFEWASPAPRSDRPAAPSDLGYTHLSIEVTDIEAEYARLQGLGMTFTMGRPGDLGSVKSIYGRDPDGNVIELQELVEPGVYALEALSLPQSVAGSPTA